MLSFLYVYSDHSILECYNLFSGVELSMRSFFVIIELTTIITLEYLGIGEKANIVKNVGNHLGYVFCLFCSHRSGDFISGSNVDCGETVLVFIPI